MSYALQYSKTFTVSISRCIMIKSGILLVEGSQQPLVEAATRLVIAAGDLDHQPRSMQ